MSLSSSARSTAVTVAESDIVALSHYLGAVKQCLIVHGCQECQSVVPGIGQTKWASD